MSLVPYVHSFYCEGHGAWFWVEADQSIANPASGDTTGATRRREGQGRVGAPQAEAHRENNGEVQEELFGGAAAL